MSYTLTLHCGCSVYVACDPLTKVPHTRVIETRAAACHVRRHEIGLRLNLWDLLPDPSSQELAVPRLERSHRFTPDGRRRVS